MSGEYFVLLEVGVRKGWTRNKRSQCITRLMYKAHELVVAAIGASVAALTGS